MGPSAAAFVPQKANHLSALREAAKHCQGCDLYKYATQTVFGEGPETAKIILLGQQPGDQEDRTGHPFVGPAGRLLNQALDEVGLDRFAVYISNVVKHFKYKKKGPLRFHQKPTGPEIRACRPWLEAEVQLIHPEIIVCLGVSASEWVLGRKVTIKNERGRLQSSPFGGQLLVTTHPSAILRMPDPQERHAAYRALVKDLKLLIGDVNRRSNEPVRERQ